METKPLNEDGSHDTATNNEDIRPSSPDKLLPDTPSTQENASDPKPDNIDQSETGLDTTGSDTTQSEPGSETKDPESTNDSGGDVKRDSLSSTPKPDSLSRSPSSQRVQFGAGTKEQDGSKKGVKRLKRSFKDIVLTEVMKADPDDLATPSSGATPKGILKVRSDPGLSGSDPEKGLSYVNKGYEGEDADNTTGGVATTNKSAFPFLSRSDSTGSGHGFADVVDLLIQRTSLDFGGRDVHPFGRDCSIEGIMQASRPKSHSKNSAFSKLVIWITLLSFLLAAAFGVIFLSETYNAKQRSEKLLKASMNTSTT